MEHELASSESQSPTLSGYIKDRGRVHEEMVNLSVRIYDIVAKLKGMDSISAASEEASGMQVHPDKGMIDELLRGNSKLSDVLSHMKENLYQIELFVHN